MSGQLRAPATYAQLGLVQGWVGTWSCLIVTLARDQWQRSVDSWRSSSKLFSTCDEAVWMMSVPGHEQRCLTLHSLYRNRSHIPNTQWTIQRASISEHFRIYSRTPLQTEQSYINAYAISALFGKLVNKMRTRFLSVPICQVESG